MSTLYTQADSNIKKTWLFVTLFLLFIIALGWFFSYLLDSPVILWIAVIFSILMNFVSYWYSDKIVLTMVKARLIEKADNPELYRVVENLSITAGLPIPKIYIIEESQPNAFATGRDAKHAVIAVTRGLLEKLDRTELEGVIAHELSHIGNKDMLLSTMIVVLVGIVSMISNFFLRISYWGGGRKRDRGSGASILFLFGIVAAILAPIAATLIRLVISRKREFLADASGALLTRYPDGLIRALEKISNDPTPLRVANNTTSHLYISNPFKNKQTNNWISKLFMTHPPTEERISALKEIKV
ncbi:MAG: M48 family metallopeptidase [Patescibacteria group bacterium]|nr:M48 family metallopeptidase [Patescibacteria group bacterium]MBU1877304.1 M48 family metallopeptidase [Patescibacteria group bacterium]